MQIGMDHKEFKKRVEEMGVLEKDTPIVFQKTVNSTLSSMKTFTATKITKEYYIDKSYVKSKIKIRRINKNIGEGYIYSKHRPIFVSRFKIENNKSRKRGALPVHVNVKKSESGGYIKGAFVAPIKNKHGEYTGKTGVFVRTGKLTKDSENRSSNLITKKIRGGQENQELEAVYGPGVTSMMNNADVQSVIFDKTEKKFEKALDKSVNKIFDKVLSE